MIDKIILKFFGWIDNLSNKVAEALTFDFPNCKKKKTKNVKSPDKRMDFPIE